MGYSLETLGVMSFTELTDFTGPTDMLDKLIKWKAGSYGVLKHYRLDTITKGAHMQRQFTIELRVDFADRDKLPELRQTLLHAARHCYSTAQLLSDTPKTTQIAVIANDFFSPPEEIALLEDVIAKGMAQTGMTSEPEGADNISDELAAAVTGG